MNPSSPAKEPISCMNPSFPKAPISSWESIPAVSIQLNPPPPVEWDIANILQSDDGPACWFGDSGSYKSYLALHVAQCISNGGPVFGEFETKKRNRVTYVNLDAGKTSFERRVCRLPKSNANLHIVSAESWDSYEFECLIADNYGAFVILDCWTEFYDQPANADMARHMRDSIKFFRDKCAEQGVNGIVIDHSKRAQSGSSLRGGDLMYGSAQKKATWRQMALIEKVAPSIFVPGHARVKFSCVKMSEGEEFRPFHVDLTIDNESYSCKYAGLVTREDDEVRKIDGLRERIVEHLKAASPDVHSASEIAGAIGAQRHSHSFSDALKAAVESAAVRSVGKSRSTKYVYLESQPDLKLQLPDTLTTAGL